jgi:circadian clock protein KaiC
MFKNCIDGLDESFKCDTDIPCGSVVLVTGIEGGLKSGFVFNLISNYLAGNSEHALYATLEESEQSHLKNMAGFGFKKSDRLHYFDYKDIRHEWQDEEPDMVRITKDMIDFYKKKYNNLTVFVMDSLNALYSLSNQTLLRKNIYHFFLMLKDNNLTSFIIMETASFKGHSLVYSDYTEHPEYFLADGIIELGMIEVKENVKRYIQIRKMRGSNHSIEKHQIIVGRNGLNILGSIY